MIERPGPIHVSNVALIDPKDKRPTRVGIERVDGKGVPHRAPLQGEARLMARRQSATARLKSRYEQEIRPSLVERFGYSTPMQAP